MTVRLIVDETPWRSHVSAVAAATTRAGIGLFPVVKGNGYGFGRVTLADLLCTGRPGRPDQSGLVPAGSLAGIAVGTVHELTGIGAERFAEVLVLSPATSVDQPLAPNVVPTVGNLAHLDALRQVGWQGRVSVKLESSMHRYGIAPGEHDAFLAAVTDAGMEPCRYLIHPPLITDGYSSDNACGEIAAWFEWLDPTLPLSVSHLAADAATRLTAELRSGSAADRSERRVELRLGTALWLGDKSFVHLDADVVDTRPVAAATTAGYRRTPVGSDGTLVMIGAGSAHGVAPLTDGRSPFHFARQRLALHEAPHMHTSMIFVPHGQPCPTIGDRVDLQRPLITTTVDTIEWS